MLEKSKQKNSFDKNKFIINNKISFPSVRIIDENNYQVGIYKIEEALKLAEEKNLDLVLINDKTEPPIVRIIDYGKFKFTQEKKSREAKKKQHQITVKEIKMRYKIEDHDYQVRINQAIKFLKLGNKVKISLTFKGREIQYIDLAEKLIEKIIHNLSPIAEHEKVFDKEGKNLYVMLLPKKT
nr:translation initiation factor 3 [Galdieria sp.]WDA99622.1 translation initiation factor 3 [Galdieria sulphuraria]